MLNFSLMNSYMQLFFVALAKGIPGVPHPLPFQKHFVAVLLRWVQVTGS